MTDNIPKLIHQLWIGDKPPPRNAMNSVKTMNDDYEYMLWNEELIAEKLIINSRYQRKIDGHSAIWGKADMYRYLILEQFGGIFIDADMVSIERLDDFLLNKAFFCFENELKRPDLCATSLQGYPPHHIIPQTAIKWIMDNNVNVEKTKIESWILVGPGLLTRTYHELISDKSVVNVFPSYYGLPDHHTGTKYLGHGKVYMSHEWGSTKDSYKNINEMDIPAHHKKPKDTMEIYIPKSNPKKLKEYMRSIKNMNGHFNIKLNYEGNLSKYLTSMRFVSQNKYETTDDGLVGYDIEDLEYYNEYGMKIDNTKIEDTEQKLSEKWISEDDIVLELGARYGSVSCLVNRMIKNKISHYVVEPDENVWTSLENNMKRNNCDFKIIKGVIGNKKYRLEGKGYAMSSVEDNNSNIETFQLPEIPFNTLISDCEGYTEIFYNENKELFNTTLKKIIIECDCPDKCDYEYLLKEWANIGFIVEEYLVEYGLHFYVLIKK
tara:strand:- start:19 stop:1491 length:1473 start_codon:yes stop_codon:yes gene_type:complete